MEKIENYEGKVVYSKYVEKMRPSTAKLFKHEEIGS